MVITKSFRLEQSGDTKKKVLNWLRQFSTFCFLDSSLYGHHQKVHEVLVGAGVRRIFSSSEKDALGKLQNFISEKESWLFGHLNYDLYTTERPDIIESAGHDDKLLFANTCFFEPEILLRISNNEITITAEQPAQVFEQIQNCSSSSTHKEHFGISVQSRMNKDTYVSLVKKLQEHIQRGDCYEINFCQEFFAEAVAPDPFSLYEKLNTISPNPFSALYRVEDKWLICASPERFLKKTGNNIISQPIKGTLPRTISNEADLPGEQQRLLNSAKDRAENVMVVDIVRNDLSKICKQGSVKVEELFGIYSFPHLHQMISTVSSILRENVTFSEIITAAFPMGSMTGAPKIKVMELISRYEQSHRGIFSGTVGYINPSGDFDFNVIIRSLMYNSTTKYLSFQAGSGITIYADAETEWEECLLKTKAIKEILQ